MNHQNPPTERPTIQNAEDRKNALIMAAMDIFGEYGLKGATVRMIASKAQSNVASIPYYFGGKDGLYTALIHYITSQISLNMNQISQEIMPIINKKSIATDEALTAILHIFSGVSSMMIESDEPKSWAKIITREQANPSPAFDILYDGVIRPNQIIMHGLIATYTERSPEDDTVKIIAHTLMGQMLGFLICREDILRALGTGELTPDHIQNIKLILNNNIKHTLQSYKS